MLKFDLPAIRERNDLAAVAGGFVALKRRGDRWTGLCPFHAERTPSFHIWGRGAAAHYHCFGCGAHGDVIGFICAVEGKGFTESCRMLTQLGGLDDPRILQNARWRADHAARRAEAEDLKRADIERRRAHGIWAGTQAIGRQTLALAYYAGRGIDPARLPGGRLPADIRYHPGLDYFYSGGDGGRKCLGVFPAIVAAIRGADGRGIGVEIKYLDPLTGQKAQLCDPETGEVLTAKKMRGNPWGGAVRLTGSAPLMGFGEGVETCLSVLTAAPDMAVWAALSIGNLAGAGKGRGRRIGLNKYLPPSIPDLDRPAFMPPAECRQAILLEDADNADPAAADCLYARTAARWKAAGLTVSRARPPAGLDFNDVIKIRERFAA
jgi:hypothetical protein